MKRASDGNTPVASKTSRTQSRENISLNQETVRVFCRIRPLKEDSTSCCVKLLSETTLSLTADTKSQRKDCNYVFKQIFSSFANQREVFDNVALPLLEDLVNGKSGLLFTYGVTGSGKTFTLTGDQSNPGIMPRCIDTLFNTIGDYQARKFLIKSDKMNGFEVQSEQEASEERSREIKSLKRYKTVKKNNNPFCYENDRIKLQGVTETNRFAVFITYIEIYNNIVYDLLDESTGEVLQSKAIRKDFHNNMYVNGVVEVEVKSAAETFELFCLGQKRKHMAHTTLNAESSRSHSVFNIRLVQLQQIVQNNQGQQMIPDQNLLKVGQLSLVDLAGTERSKRTQNIGMRLKETGNINNSLMSLRACLEILRENQLTGSNKLVPYRDSRLTFLFKNYFEGEGQVRMVVCVNPSVEDYEENLQVLRFAEITQEVKVPRSEARYTPYKTPKSTKPKPQIQTRSTIKAKKSASFGPEIPSIKFNYDNVKQHENELNNLIKILKARKQKRETCEKNVTKMEENFRRRLVTVNQVFVFDKSETQNIRATFKKQKNMNLNLEHKITDLETINNELLSKNKDLKEVVQALQNTIEKKNLKINQNLLACEVRKEKLALQNARLLKEHEEKLRKQHAQHEAELEFKNVKLKKVKDLVDDSYVPVITSIPTAQHYHDYEPHQTPNTYRRNVHRTLPHRRSRSAGEAWLEHNTVKPVALGTVFQPAMKKRKSVTKLDKLKDVTNSKQNKYCLIAQEVQNGGKIETNLYKGDILPTCGGGAQVIFNEVEQLKQVSPVENDK
ncbi:hypothetical protein ILUMI_26363 [Ignelater luminosus]|uniref:Kinesin motor domain-containing protein n=1 Tax=Ignelater luminosus TaxID=2038154 RepID=A0A8K0C6T6_IGNLU|nr:hypothetical protein ILUMI_26363 [Ignelater luminosus]